jgi:ubiquitin-conjugating enzyme E2 T
MSEQVRQARIGKEMERLSRDPPPGIMIWKDDDAEGAEKDLFKARITPPDDTPYRGGCFELEIRIPQRYPFEAPIIRFATKIFHPNVDEQGRICLDSLKLPPNGSWKPSLNLGQVLAQIQILMGEPGLSDPLLKDVAELYKDDRERFRQIASEWTAKYAMSSGQIRLGTPDRKRTKLITSDTAEEEKEENTVLNE